MKLADLTLGCHYNAWAVLHILAGKDVDTDNGWRVETAPWYNGRERGFTFTISNFKKTLHVAVFEHRNSDDICALRWEGESDINPPTCESDCEKAYHGKNKWDGIAHTVEYNEAGKMAEWVQNELENFADQHSKEVEDDPVVAPDRSRHP